MATEAAPRDDPLGSGEGIPHCVNPSCAAQEGDAAGEPCELMLQRGSGSLHSWVRVMLKGTIHIIPTLLGAI